jgi:hypothetical protein
MFPESMSILLLILNQNSFIIITINIIYIIITSISNTLLCIYLHTRLHTQKMTSMPNYCCCYYCCDYHTNIHILSVRLTFENYHCSSMSYIVFSFHINSLLHTSSFLTYCIVLSYFLNTFSYILVLLFLTQFFSISSISVY